MGCAEHAAAGWCALTAQCGGDAGDVIWRDPGARCDLLDVGQRVARRARLHPVLSLGGAIEDERQLLLGVAALADRCRGRPLHDSLVHTFALTAAPPCAAPARPSCSWRPVASSRPRRARGAPPAVDRTR